MKIANIDREVLHIFWTTFNEIFRKDVTYDNIEKYKKEKFHLLFRRCIFRKKTDGGGGGRGGAGSRTQIPPRPTPKQF